MGSDHKQVNQGKMAIGFTPQRQVKPALACKRATCKKTQKALYSLEEAALLSVMDIIANEVDCVCAAC
jgi:hypothetical protein